MIRDSFEQEKKNLFYYDILVTFLGCLAAETLWYKKILWKPFIQISSFKDYFLISLR